MYDLRITYFSSLRIHSHDTAVIALTKVTNLAVIVFKFALLSFHIHGAFKIFEAKISV